MKRIQLFEFEDFTWFPAWMRSSMTKLIVVMHRLLKTDEQVARLLAPVMEAQRIDHILDLCSGSGGPMLRVWYRLSYDYHIKDLKLTLTDLYPDLQSAHLINSKANGISYRTNSVDATSLDDYLIGMRTMVGSFHHMNPKNARKIVESAFTSKQPIFIFEISDNSFPLFLWWAVIPFNFIMCFFVTLLVRPLSWHQLVFTYLIPILPFFFAWDGAASNARTYTLNDLDLLLEGLDSSNYEWRKGLIRGMSNRIYLLGIPK